MDSEKISKLMEEYTCDASCIVNCHQLPPGKYQNLFIFKTAIIDNFDTVFKNSKPDFPLPEEWNTVATGFFEYLQIEKNYSEHTIYNYMSDLYFFFCFLFKRKYRYFQYRSFSTTILLC